MKKDNAEILFLSFIFILPLLVNLKTGGVEDAKLYGLFIASFLLCFTRGFFKANWTVISTILLLLLGIFVTFTSDNINISLWGSEKRYLGLLAWAAAGFISLKTVFLNDDEKFGEKLTNCLIFSGALTAVTAMILGFFGMGLFDYRIGGTMGNPNALGELLCVTTFLTLTKFRNPKYLPLLLIQVAALTWSGNRMSWIALALGLIFYLHYTSKNLKLSFLSASVLFLIFILGFDRFYDTTSIITRLDIYDSAFSVISQNPLGYGFDQIEKTLTPEHFTLLADRAHNVFLDTAITMGIPGLILLLIITLNTFQKLRRNKNPIYKKLGFAFLILMLSLQSSFFTITHLVLFFVFVGLSNRKIP